MKALVKLLMFVLLWVPLTVAAQQNDAVRHYLETDYGVRFTEGNSMTILPTGRRKFEVLEQDLRAAQHSIHMDYFALRADSISRIVLDILRERAAQGVEVRLIIDAFGNGKGEQKLDKRGLRQLRQAGLQVVMYDPMRFPWVNKLFHRDHRKIVVVDGHTGYIGGMNVADHYVRGTERIKNWRDMHFRVTGPAVAELQRVFINSWNAMAHDNLQGTQYYSTAKPRIPSTDVTDACVGVVHRTPSADNQWPIRNHRIARDAMRSAIESAQHHIQIVNPYFMPSRMIRKALRRALKRGVKVELMVGEQCDVPITPRAVDHYTQWMMKHGAEVYYRKGVFHHTKVLTVDDSLCYVGSVNMDQRSLYCDYECNLMVGSRQLADTLQRIFRQDQEHSFQLTRQTWRQRFSLGRRIASKLVVPLRPVL